MSTGVYEGLPASAGGTIPDPVVDGNAWPEEAGRCAIVWNVAWADGDSDDPDSLPDVTPLDNAKVRIRPSRECVTFRTGTRPTTFLLRDIVCNLENGCLTTPGGRPYVIVVPSSGGGIAEEGWTYTATVERNGSILHTVTFDAPANTTVDLTMVTSTEPSAGSGFSSLAAALKAAGEAQRLATQALEAVSEIQSKPGERGEKGDKGDPGKPGVPDEKLLNHAVETYLTNLLKPKKIIQIEAGNFPIVFLDNKNQVWAWRISTKHPTKILEGKRIRILTQGAAYRGSGSANSLLAVDTDNQAWQWDYFLEKATRILKNKKIRALAQGINQKDSTPYILAVDTDNQAWQWDYKNPPTRILENQRIETIAASWEGDRFISLPVDNSNLEFWQDGAGYSSVLTNNFYKTIKYTGRDFIATDNNATLWKVFSGNKYDDPAIIDEILTNIRLRLMRDGNLEGGNGQSYNIPDNILFEKIAPAYDPSENIAYVIGVDTKNNLWRWQTNEDSENSPYKPLEKAEFDLETLLT